MDLSGADLSFAKVTNADFSRARLDYASLHSVTGRGANFHGARLYEVDASGLSVTHSNFSGAEMVNVDLYDSGFHKVSFREAQLIHVNLGMARLTDCDMQAARLAALTLRHTTLQNVDVSFSEAELLMVCDTSLRDVVGLSTLTHRGPSSIGLDSFFLSGGLPAEFLRGVGTPPVFVDYAASVVGVPIVINSCFISYSATDTLFAQDLHAHLTQNGVRTWFAPHDLKIGERFRNEIESSIHSHDKLLLIMSRASIASSWVEIEVEAALERETRENRSILFPIRVDDSVFQSSVAWAASIRRTRHIGDFTTWETDRAAYAAARNAC